MVLRMTKSLRIQAVRMTLLRRALVRWRLLVSLHMLLLCVVFLFELLGLLSVALLHLLSLSVTGVFLDHLLMFFFLLLLKFLVFLILLRS